MFVAIGTLKALSASGRAAASSASAAAANASSVAGPPRRASSATVARHGRAPPRPGRCGRRGRVPVEVQRRGHADQGEGVGGPVAHLAVARAGGPRQRGDVDGGDQLAVGQRGVRARVLAGQPVQVRDRHDPLAVGTQHPHRRVQRAQRDRHVRGVGGDAGVRGPRPSSVAPRTARLRWWPSRAAARTGLALVARHRGVGEVGAAGALQQVAAGGGAVAQLPARPASRAGPAAGTARAPALAGQVGVGHRGTDPQPAVGQVLDLGRVSCRTSTSTSGVATPSRMRSTRLVPPPR